MYAIDGLPTYADNRSLGRVGPVMILLNICIIAVGGSNIADERVIASNPVCGVALFGYYPKRLARMHGIKKHYLNL